MRDPVRRSVNVKDPGRRGERGRPARLHAVVKRVVDVTVCLALLPFVALVVAVCGVAIRLESPGPVFYRQDRTGRHGVRFRMFKLRTMVANAEELKPALAHLNVLPPPDFKIPNDPRITRVGRFLRKTSLDELPQIFNVLRGEMSLVGPRPTSFHSGTYELWHTERLEALPGITGLWQVSGRNETTFDERVRLDVEYAQRASLGLDLRIALRTLVCMVRGDGL